MEGSLLLLLAVFVSGVFAQGIIPRGPGESVTVRCEYTEKYRNSSKTWCRETDHGKCNRILTTRVTDEKRVLITSGDTSLSDDKINRVMSVTVRNLREEDSGRYLCGPYNHDENKITSLKKTELQVSREVRIPSVTTSSADKHSPTVTMGYIQGEAMNASAASPRNCTSRYVVCVSDPKVIALVSIVLVNKVLMVAGLYVALRRSAGRKKAHRRTYY